MKLPTLILFCLILAACAIRPSVLDEDMAAAQSALESAIEAGAEDLAFAELQQARQTLELARQARDNDEARRLANKAESEAREAATQARTRRMALLIADLEEGMSELRAQIRSASN